MLGFLSPSKTAPLRLSLVGQNCNNNTYTCDSSQKKKRKSNSITGPASMDEENANRTTMVDCMMPTVDTDSNHLKSLRVPSNRSPNVSECGTELSSVSQRRQWLKGFEKKQAGNAFRSMKNKEKARDNDDRNINETRVTNAEKEGRESPPEAPSANSGFAAAIDVPVSYHTTAVTSSAKKPRNPRPRVNRRASSSTPSWVGVKKEEVKATDDGHASVASLSKWLANDPTSAKKKRHVRRGRNIFNKSRQFEQDSDNVIVMEANIARGAVGDKKKWLQNAFQAPIEEDDEDEDDAYSSFSGYVKSDVGRFARSNPRFNRQGAQTEIITDDAASSLSVADKKDWLKKAFVKNSEERKKQGYNMAQTDVMHNRGQDEAKSRAKLRFKERSARKLMGATSTRPSGSKPIPSVSSSDSNEGTNRVAPESEKVSADPKESIFRPLEEDKTPVDFRSAREALVQRSKKNGHNAQVVNKVLLRKKKFEKLEDESRRKSMSTGLVLKTSWDISESSDGRPSNVYEKKYVNANDIAHKKSFEELP